MIVFLRVAPGLPGAGSPVLYRESERGPVLDARGREWPLRHGLGAELVLWVLDGPRPLPPACLAPAGALALTRAQRAHLVAAGCLVDEAVAPVLEGAATAPRLGRARRVAASTPAPPVRSGVQVRLFS